MSDELEQAITIWKDRMTGSVNYDECPLCVKHMACRGCPVRLRTGEVNCEGTPFYDYQKARHRRDTDNMIFHATEMLELLESCR
jgi:hypothetical protein